MILIHMADHLVVHLCHQRAGGVHGQQIPAVRFFPNGGRHPMGTENHGLAVRNFIQFIHKNDTPAAKIFHNGFVVNDLFAHMQRSALLP